MERFLACFLVLLLSPLTTAGQPREPVTRARTFSVVVDVVVTDNNNRLVTDLRKEDFSVYEDDRPRPVEVFYSAGQRRQDDREASEAAGGEQGQPAAVPSLERPSLFIVLLDYATVEYLNQNYIRDAAIRYVEEKFQPGDLMAVFQVGAGLRFLQNFTDDREALISALSRMDPTGSHYAGDQDNLTDSAEAAQSHVAMLASSIESLAAGAGPGSVQQLAQLERLNQQMQQAQILEGRYYAQRSFSREQQARPVLGAIHTIARGVEHLEGRKTLILFSQGFHVPASLERALQRAVDRANQSSLSVYAVDGGGLQHKAVRSEGELYDVSALRPGDRTKAYQGLTQFDLAREIGSGQKDSTLRFLSSATGGFLTRHTNDFSKALNRIDAEARSHYILTYQPEDLNFDGRFREIRVVVNKPGLKVRARPGYWAVHPAASLLSPEEYRDLMAQGPANPDFQFHVQPLHFLGEGGDYLVHLVMDVPLDAMTLSKLEHQNEVSIEAVGLLQDAKGEVISSFRGPSRVRFSSGDQEFLRLSNWFSLPPGDYSFSILLVDSLSGRSSFQQRSLSLTPFPEGLGISSLVLCDAVSSAPAGPSDVFDVSGVRVSPSASRDFSEAGQLVYYFQLYGADRTGTGDLRLDLALLKEGREVGSASEKLGTVDSEPNPVPHLRFSRSLAIGGLQAGSYILRAIVRDETTGQTVRTQAAFKVRVSSR
jgi:VWFA-related protein